jgi:hypothetical protein
MPSTGMAEVVEALPAGVHALLVAVHLAEVGVADHHLEAQAMVVFTHLQVIMVGTGRLAAVLTDLQLMAVTGHLAV